ncbi:MAG TPA: alpha/beta fold hydrolase [Nitrospira sp.]|jgi:pimeloyl-ACP methyl ester carboxylesterase|nr:alpha/beta fold hydrolase [Nitrospira sp.]HMZ56607.1 alpha/beta fold hydrolase [Nitrospira sp.]HNB83375.1 alpha/beta fold hydrolase [Pseudomonadales bacterium]HNL31893.1 alpha/beta fold hydrolase [Pseudomonadales bacterium]
MRRLTLLLLLATLASGCASLPGKTTTKIDDRRVEYVLSRKGNATVVFENGLGATLDWWAKVVPEIANDATTFAYNRPGYGNSDAATTPRDGIHVVDELRALLESQGLRPPYVLVGHSLGGLYMQLFARRYPDEVSALVLVDSTHPEQLKGAGARENWPAWARVVFGVATSATAKQEMDVIDATGEEVLRLSTFTGKPVIVLSALQPMSKKSALADDANAKRKDIARLYPGSSQIWVDSGHGIPLEKPTAVISKIREVLP